MGLNTLEPGVIAAYLVGVTLFGLHFLRKQQTLKGYFFACRTISLRAVSPSIVAAETSTLTAIGIPGVACALDLRLRLCTGISFARYVGLGSGSSFLMGCAASGPMLQTERICRAEEMKCVCKI